MDSQPANGPVPAAPVKGVTLAVPPIHPPRLIASGLQLGYVPEEPLVCIYPSFSIDNGYELFAAAYLPAGSINVSCSDNFTVTQKVSTEAGTLDVREIIITYTTQNESATVAYDLWQFHFLYQVGENDSVAAVRVRTSENDPVTRRGTVTTVIKT